MKDGVFLGLAGLLQPCQPLENPVLPSSFTQMNPILKGQRKYQRKYKFLGLCTEIQIFKDKSCIRETLNLLLCAQSSNDTKTEKTGLERLHDFEPNNHSNIF